MIPPKINPSRLATLCCALGGTALQVFQNLVSRLPDVSQACPWLAPLSVVAGGVAAIGFSRIANLWDKHNELNDAARDLLTNRDIAIAQARAVQARLRKYVKDLDGPKMSQERNRLAAIAEAAPEWWVEAVADPFRQDLQKLRDDEIV